MHKLVTGVLLFIVTFSSCTKKEEKKNILPDETIIWQLGEAKDYLWAKPGTYWVYKHSLTGALDTHHVVSFFFDSTQSSISRHDGKNVENRYEVLETTINSSYQNETYQDISVFILVYDQNGRSQIYSFERNAKEGKSSIFHKPFKEFSLSGPGSNVTTFLAMDTTYSVLGKVYSQVVSFYVMEDGIGEKDCSGSHDSYLYWAKDVGIIRKVIQPCNYQWDLIDYHIEK